MIILRKMQVQCCIMLSALPHHIHKCMATSVTRTICPTPHPTPLLQGHLPDLPGNHWSRLKPASFIGGKDTKTKQGDDTLIV